MFLLNILEAILAYDLVKIRFIKEKEVILNGNTNDKSRGFQLQSTLVISKSKGLSGILRDIRTSTYQICGIAEINKSNNHNS